MQAHPLTHDLRLDGEAFDVYIETQLAPLLNNGDVVILAPPYNVTDAEMEEIVAKTAKSIRQVLNASGLG